MLGVFDALHERPATSDELAERLSLDPLGAETLVTALATLGYLERAEDGRWRNSASHWLMRSSGRSSSAASVAARRNG